MNRFLKWTMPAVALAATVAGAVFTEAKAQDLVVGVSWSNFQEERWKTDEAAIKAALAAAGAKYISADAQSDPTKQLNDVQSLIAGGAKALIVLAQDAKAIEPAITAALNEGIPVIGYDRLIAFQGRDDDTVDAGGSIISHNVPAHRQLPGGPFTAVGLERGEDILQPVRTEQAVDRAPLCDDPRLGRGHRKTIEDRGDRVRRSGDLRLRLVQALAR